MDLDQIDDHYIIIRTRDFREAAYVQSKIFQVRCLMVKQNRQPDGFDAFWCTIVGGFHLGIKHVQVPREAFDWKGAKSGIQNWYPWFL